jgi:transcriptional regulator with XRE-family HTH domain
MTPSHCRAARALLDWTQQEIAHLARVSVVTIRNFENQKSTPQRATLDVIQRAFEAAGVEFTNGDRPGVRLVGPTETPAGPKPAATRRAKTSKRKE